MTAIEMFLGVAKAVLGAALIITGLHRAEWYAERKELAKTILCCTYVLMGAVWLANI